MAAEHQQIMTVKNLLENGANASGTIGSSFKSVLSGAAEKDCFQIAEDLVLHESTTGVKAYKHLYLAYAFLMIAGRGEDWHPICDSLILKVKNFNEVKLHGRWPIPKLAIQMGFKHLTKLQHGQHFRNEIDPESNS